MLKRQYKVAILETTNSQEFEGSREEIADFAPEIGGIIYEVNRMDREWESIGIMIPLKAYIRITNLKKRV